MTAQRVTPPGIGRTRVRLQSVVATVLVVVACVGWWLDTRVVDADGFADVVARSSQARSVREYVADQATLRLARTSNFVSAARPAVTSAVAEALATEPVEAAVRSFSRRAHEQVFKTRLARRVDIDAQQASVAVRSALQTINPQMAEKLPANVLDASATVSQSSVVDLLLRISGWIWLWIPVGILGALLLARTLRRATDRVSAIRTVGVTLAVAGALMAGLGGAAPVVGAVVSPSDPGRAGAVAAFIEVLTGRLAGAGLALIVLGLALALAPGRDGGDLSHRVVRFRAWLRARAGNARWRFAGGLGLVLLAMLLITRPAATAQLIVNLVAVVGLYVGVVICLRAAGVLETDHGISALRRRWFVIVPTVMVMALAGTASVTVALAAAGTRDPEPDQLRDGCNGYFELCAQPMNQIVWPASHNAMSSSAYNFFSAEHTITVGDQLNAGARLLMLDAYYGYDDDGLVRTNLAGGVDRRQLERERGRETVEALDRLGALTGTADTSGRRQDVYFCHDFCELGAVPAVDVFKEVDAFLDRNLTDVVVLDFEDYVRPGALRSALQESGLWDRVLRVTPEEYRSVPLGYLLSATDRRVIAVSEKHGGEVRWLPAAYSRFEETPYTFPRISTFSCAPNRGGTGRSIFLVNHWLRPDGPPDPVEAGRVNDSRTLLERFRRCAAERGRLPNVFAADFTEIGDLYRTTRDLNAAIARVTGVTYSVDRAIAHALASGELTPAEAAEIAGLNRLPQVSEPRARRLLGRSVDALTVPRALEVLNIENCVLRAPDTGLAEGPVIPGRYVVVPVVPKSCPEAARLPGAPASSSTATPPPAAGADGG